MAEDVEAVQEREIRPIPPSQLGSLGNARQEPEEDDDDSVQDAPQGPYVFAGREWPSQKAAEAAFSSMRGRENPKDKQIAQLQGELDRRGAQIDILSRARERAETGEAPTKVETQELQRFYKTLTPDQVEQFNGIQEAKGDATAFAWLLDNFETHQSGRIEKLEKALSDLKRSAIDEPNEVRKESEEWEKNITDNFVGALQVAQEGDGPVADTFATVFPPDQPEIHAQRLDEIHQIMLDPHMNLDDTREHFWFATLVWLGYNSLPSVQKGNRGSSVAKGRRQERVADPTLSNSRAGSRPRTSAGEPSFLGQSSRSGPLGKL